MKYNQPYGEQDPNAGYKDRNTPGAIAGSKVPSAAIEHPQREIMAVIAAAGIEGSSSDLTQLLQAIDHRIAAATGGAGDPNYVLMTQARVRLPIFPEVLTADGRIPVTSPVTGQIRVPAGYDFLHRGIFNVTTVQTDFATAANKIYHLRWTPSAGFALKDLADVAYNPGAVPETDTSFDSAYDSMLIAKVATSAGNVATITRLINKEHLSYRGDVALSDAIVLTGSPGYTASRDGVAFTYDFARAPTQVTPVAALGALAAGGSLGLDGVANLVRNLTVTRYGTSFSIQSDFNGVVSGLYVEATLFATA